MHNDQIVGITYVITAAKRNALSTHIVLFSRTDKLFGFISSHVEKLYNFS